MSQKDQNRVLKVNLDLDGFAIVTTFHQIHVENIIFSLLDIL